MPALNNVLKLLATSSISDGAKITFLIFLMRKEAKEPMPSYSELCKLRGVAKSTIQLHVGELELHKLLTSIRLPDNRKQYLINPKVLAEPEKEESVANKAFRNKPVGKYTFYELGRYFYFVNGMDQWASQEDARRIRFLQKEIGAQAVVNLMDVFKQRYKRNHWGEYSIDNFLDRRDDLEKLV